MVAFPLSLSFVVRLVRTFYFLGTGLGGGRKRSLQLAAMARTADRKTGQNVRRHDLYSSNASMNKQKNKLREHGQPGPCILP